MGVISLSQWRHFYFAKGDVSTLLPQCDFRVCQGKVEMSSPRQSRNVAFGPGLSGVHVNLPASAKRRRALLASNLIEE
jgi:hypothetical protein